MRKTVLKIIRFILNPRLLLCILLAWFITNGWSYVALAIGSYFHIIWLMTVSGAYLALLWIPFTPEKIITLAIAIALLQKLFPNDLKTLAVLKELYKKAKSAVMKRHS